jgi:hypothetical protein
MDEAHLMSVTRAIPTLALEDDRLDDERQEVKAHRPCISLFAPASPRPRTQYRTLIS